MSLRTGRWHLGRIVLTATALAVVGWSAGMATAAGPVAGQIEAHLAAGEFGPALAAASRVQDVGERTRLLEQIAAAQLAAGEFNGARGTTRRIPTREGRAEMRGEAARERGMQGGTGADPSQLIELIMNHTGGPETGPWETIDGEGAPDPFFFNSNETGVRVDPNSLLYRLTEPEQNGRLQSLGRRARVAALNADMAKASSLRFVSLTRLEKAVAACLENGQPVHETMRQLAGLSRIQYVMIDETSGDVLIAGPAEGWKYNAQGLPVGVSSGTPTLQLDDLVVVLRTFGPGGRGIFGCSINPRTEGLKAVKQFVEASQAKGPLGPGQLPKWLKEIESRMGLQDIEIYGIPADTRAGRVLVEADYRMKLIGIGKMDGGKGIPSIFELLPLADQKNPPPLDALRWWLTMKYDAILHSPDRTVFEVKGSSVLVQSEDQIVTNDGGRIQTGKATGMNQNFARNFTANYAELARRDLVFADLQNVFDLGMVAALTHSEKLASRAGWDLGVFAPEGAYRPARVAAPKTVHSVINHRVYRGTDIVVQVAGGVRADLVGEIRKGDMQQEKADLKQITQKTAPPTLPEGRWWWDAAE